MLTSHSSRPYLAPWQLVDLTLARSNRRARWCSPAAAPAGRRPAAGRGPVTAGAAAPELFVLEMAGVPPEDTVVTFPPGQPRGSSCATAPRTTPSSSSSSFPPTASRTRRPGIGHGESSDPRPGVYGLDRRRPVPPGRGAPIRFKYPVHFAAPLDGRGPLWQPARFERALSIADAGRQTATGACSPSDRPASDNLQAPLGGRGLSGGGADGRREAIGYRLSAISYRLSAVRVSFQLSLRAHADPP